MEVESVEPKLKPKQSTSNSCSDGWRDKRLCIVLLPKLVFNFFGGRLTFCVSGMFDPDKFRKKFLKLRSGIVLFEMSHYLPRSCFDTCLKEKGMVE